MLKKVLAVSLVIPLTSFATTSLKLHHDSVERLKEFKILEHLPKSLKSSNATSTTNSLQQKNQTKTKTQIITRYQQLYQGIPVIGAEVTINKSSLPTLNAKEQGKVNGMLLEDIQLNTHPAISSQKAIALAKANTNTTAEPLDVTSQLQIRADESNTLFLVYLVSFKSTKSNGQPVWPFFVIDAQTGAIIKQWNNIKTHEENGPGGNEKVKEYWYGLDGLPALKVRQDGQKCTMDSELVKLVNVNSAWDWNNRITAPVTYPCGKNTEDLTNGAYSPGNDAYYFGQTIVDMYQDWYGVKALQKREGAAMKLVMRVHFGKKYDNAFWDGEAMSFGDGDDLYPLVSLDIAGHEVTHGFTEQHSGLEYHDQSGALNESMSDMAGQAARAYLLEKNPALYNKAYLTPNKVTWGIGETVMKGAGNEALRYMDKPSTDRHSADCLDKDFAQKNGASCKISYKELIAFAQSSIPDPQDRQDYIVHTASGVFNKAFYLIAQNLGIQSAYKAMIQANTHHWTPTTDFNSGACGVVFAAQDLSLDVNVVKSAFDQVGIDTATCSN